MVDEKWFEDHGALINRKEDGTRFLALKRKPGVEHKIRRAYSITSDILAFKRCSRQYGYFAVRGYVPAQATQLYFGIVIHEVLDRAHRQFRGLMEGKANGVPSDSDIASYFVAVTDALKARGIRPYSQRARETALNYLQRFNSRHGPDLYPRVWDTEHKLKVDMKDFYMHGVVDVLARSKEETNPESMEIWDYKGSRRVGDDSDEMQAYRLQMRVYAELYKRKNGVFPSRAVLCFLGEESVDKMLVQVDFDPGSISEAMKTFVDTVAEIENRLAVDDWAPPKRPPSTETCGGCDIRWDCPTMAKSFPLRYP